MNPSTALFDLIHSLDRHEKRYFKIYASVYKAGNIHLKLFEMVNKQKNYQEQVLKAYFKKNEVSWQFSAVKNYLFNLVLDSLESFHREKSIEFKISKGLSQCSVLCMKKLYKPALKKILKIKNMAEVNGKHLLLLEAYALEEQVLSKSGDLHGLEKYISKGYADEKKILEAYQNLRSFSCISKNAFILGRKKHNPKNKRDLNQFEKLVNSPLMKSEKNAISPEALKIYYNIKSQYFYESGNYAESIKFIKKQVKLLEGQKITREKSDEYLAALHNLGILNISLKNFTEALKLTEKLKVLHLEEKNFKALELYQLIRLTIFMETAKFDEVTRIADEFETDWDSITGTMNNVSLLLIRYYFTIGHMVSGNFIKALFYVNQILNDKEDIVRQDIFGYARILNIIIHFELNNKELLPYLLKSAYRFFYKSNRLFLFEKIILRNIRKLTSNNTWKSKAELRMFFEELKKELLEVTNDPFERKAFQYFDFISWLESKIGDRSFAEIAKEKAYLI